MSPELINIELARLVEDSSAWRKRFDRYDRLINAGLSCDEAATIITAEYQIDLLAETEVRHAA